MYHDLTEDKIAGKSKQTGCGARVNARGAPRPVEATRAPSGTQTIHLGETNVC